MRYLEFEAHIKTFKGIIRRFDQVAMSTLFSTGVLGGIILFVYFVVLLFVQHSQHTVSKRLYTFEVRSVHKGSRYLLEYTNAFEQLQKLASISLRPVHELYPLRTKDRLERVEDNLAMSFHHDPAAHDGGCSPKK